MTSQADRLVDDYLEELGNNLAGVPRARRRELLEEISEHIAEARSALETDSEVEVRNLLQRLGDPVEIAAEERARSGVAPRRAGPIEILALIGLLAGGFVFLIGWFAGLVLLWVSDAWTTGEKLVGTLIVPGGLATTFLVLTGVGTGAGEVCGSESDPVTGAIVETCTGGPSALRVALGIAFSVFLIVGPFFTTVFLARRMRRPAGAAYQPRAGSA
jgi:uncharacterized membrane protein